MLALNIFKWIGSLFEILFEPFEWMRLGLAQEKGGWWTSNIPNWFFLLVLIVLLSYWLAQSLKFKREGKEDRA